MQAVKPSVTVAWHRQHDDPPMWLFGWDTFDLSGEWVKYGDARAHNLNGTTATWTVTDR